MKLKLNRFALTLRKDIAESRRRLLTFAIGSAASIFVADTIIIIANAHMSMGALTDMLGTINVCFLIMVASLAASLSFRALGQKSTAASTLMLPASDMEKFMSRWFLTVPCVLLFVLTAVSIADLLSAWVASIIYDTGYRGPFGWINYIKGSFDSVMFISSLLFLQSFFFLGSLLWPRLSLGKSLIALTLFSVMCVVVIMVTVFSLRDSANIRMSLNILGREGIIVNMLVLTVINYIISFFRFRESEIINRW